MKRLALLVIASAAIAGAHAADLQVTVAGAKDKGALYFGLFDRAGFLVTPMATARSTVDQPVAVFRDLARGSYAVSVFQDTNGNGVLDRNLVGAPMEPVGFSNDARGNMGPPQFDAAAIEIGAESQSIAITLP